MKHFKSSSAEQAPAAAVRPTNMELQTETFNRDGLSPSELRSANVRRMIFEDLQRYKDGED